jgi:hypothetical protein
MGGMDDERPNLRGWNLQPDPETIARFLEEHGTPGTFTVDIDWEATIASWRRMAAPYN